jgi:amino acid adenylation domain-containing protein
MSEWQARNISSTFAKLFHSLIDGIDMTVDDLHSFSNHDRRQVSEWNKVPNKKIEACVHDVFMMQVLARPEAPAVCAWDEMFTYEELDGLSSRLAYYLMDLGVGPEVMVPLCFEKSAWTIVAMLAVLKAGGACVSLDPSYPFSRLKGIVCDVDAKVVLAAPVTAGILAPLVQHVLIIDKSFLASIPVSHTGPPHTAVHPANPAFVIFTSGSTGKPKGVILEHSSVCTSVEAHGSALQIGTDSRVLQFAAYVFDISIQDIFTTLMRGGCVCVPSEQERMNDLAGAINKMNVNWACITPTVASILRPSDVSGLKSLTLAGEAVTQKVTDIWEGMGNLNNCYGPAESTIYCAWNGGVGKLGRPANIGRGLSSLLWVVEVGDYDRLAPVGCVGELLVEGPLLARGYLNDPGKTAENFINDPTWASVVGESTRGRRMYRTGDLVRYNSDGTLDYLGRKDTQVKLHGQRLELGDIEHNIKVDLQSMSQVAVELVTLRNRPDGRKLAAFVCFDEHFRMSEGSAELALHMSPELQSQMMDLQTSLAKLMPPYMVPSMFIPLHYMPLNPSGKMNRHMLRGFVSEMSNEDVLLYSLANAEKRAAVTDMEKKLQGLWSLVLNLPTASVGADDSFFHLGGDSVGAMRLVAIAHEAGISLSVADIFHEPTLTAMSEVATSVVDCHIPDLEPFALMGNVESKINMMENVTALYDFS